MKQTLCQHVLFFCLTLISCGQIISVSPESSDTSLSPNADSELYVFATDYTSSGQLYHAGLTENQTTLTNSGVTLLGSSAIIRHNNGLIYVLHDASSSVSSDNVQIIDPAQDYKTLAQYSVGNGTNPKDIAFFENRAFISLYFPDRQPANIDSDGNPADVVEIDLPTGNIVNRWSFFDFLNDDGDKNANADQMVIANNILYICLQDFQSDFTANAKGLIGMISLTTGEMLGVIELAGRNPFHLAVSPDETKLFVADLVLFDLAQQDFDLNPPYGGLEIVDLGTQTPTTFFHDNDLGGFIDRVRTDENFVYFTISTFDATNFRFFSKILRFPLDAENLSDLETVDDQNTDIRDMIIDGNFLWISRREINTATGLSDPQIEVLNLDTFDLLGDTLTPLVPGMSLTKI